MKKHIGDLWIMRNSALSDLSHLTNLNSFWGRLIITENPNLTNLHGLESIDPQLISNLTITNNNSLSSCEVESICKYLDNENGIISIYNNEIGCNSQSEVNEACGSIGINDITFETIISIYPNPFYNETLISFHLSKQSLVEIELFEKDDRVITPSGSGLVMEDETTPVNNEREVMIKLDNVPAGIVYTMNGWYCVLED